MANAAMMDNIARTRKLFAGITETRGDMGSVSEELFENKAECHRRAAAGTVYTLGDTKMTFTPDPMVKFLEEHVTKLEARLRASEAHCRRYAVACGKYRSACLMMSGVVEAVRHGGDLPSSVAESLDKAMWIDIDAADALIDPVATEVVK